MDSLSKSNYRFPLTVAVVMSISGAAVFALRRSVLRSTASRAASTAAGTSSPCVGCCGGTTIQTIDPVVDEENEIERTLPPELKALHAEAVANGQSTYIDPKTGFTVFTRLGQMQKQKCCGCRCRHCPYGHINVKTRGQKATTSPPAAAAGAAAGVAKEAASAEAAKAKPAAAPQHSVVYTKTGDKGTSALFTGERRKKTDPVFEALGALDELSSHVGLARAMLRGSPEKREHDAEMMSLLEGIQQELLNAGTVVATPTGKNAEDETAKRMTDILEGYGFPAKTAEMEKVIDVIDSRLVPLRIFILPGGGNGASAQLHVCRTVCRRAERRMIEVRDLYGEGYSDHLRQATVYVNRLSDFLFVAARSVAEEDIVRKYD